jgi:inorganic pyrophosphatase
MAGDGEELDAYVLGVEQPLDQFKGKCIAIIHRIDDNEDKLIVVPDEMTLSDDEIRRLTEFQERFFEIEIIRS